MISRIDIITCGYIQQYTFHDTRIKEPANVLVEIIFQLNNELGD